jgi:transcriptional regulator with XRE-family HTH domain
MLSKKELYRSTEYWMEGIQNELYRQVEDYMEQEGLNRTQLAEKLGVTKGYVSQILNGNFNFTLKKLIEISLAIGKVPVLEFKEIGRLLDMTKADNIQPESWIAAEDQETYEKD